MAGGWFWGLVGFSSIQAEVDADRRALRACLEPAQALGHYYVGDPSGLWVTPAALAEGFQFRNSHASNLAIIERITIQGQVTASVTAVQEFSFRVDPVTAWTVQGTGGTALVPQKRKSTMVASTMTAGDIRMNTTTAAGLGAGTKTIGTNAALYSGSLIDLNAATPLAGTAGQVHVLENADAAYPLMILGNNEGFIVRNVIVWATGTCRLNVRVRWREVAAYP
jgi:hypothetical protein